MDNMVAAMDRLRPCKFVCVLLHALEFSTPPKKKKKTQKTQKRRCMCTKMRSGALAGAWCAVCCKDESHVTVESSVLAVDD